MVTNAAVEPTDSHSVGRAKTKISQVAAMAEIPNQRRISALRVGLTGDWGEDPAEEREEGEDEDEDFAGDMNTRF
jgi:hypothetical protein